MSPKYAFIRKINNDASLLSLFLISHTPLVAMSSRPPPDLYCKFKAKTSSITLKTGNKRKRFKTSTLYWYCINFKYLGGWAMADATKTTARHIGHMTYTQAPAVHENNIFHLFRFTQPVKTYSSCYIAIPLKWLKSSLNSHQ